MFNQMLDESPELATSLGLDQGARLVQRGDKVIVVTYGQMPAEEARNYAPVVVLLGDDNQVKTAA